MRIVEIERRYPALRALILVLRIVASVPTFVGIFALLVGGVEQFQHKSGAVLLISMLIAAGPLLVGLVLFALSEALQVLVDIETNTRAAHEELALLPLAIARPTTTDDSAISRINRHA